MKIYVLVLFLFSWVSYAQEEHAWVYFTDKANVEAALANPESILTSKALERKALHNITVDERDVPVNDNYIQLLKTTEGITIKSKSKWLNCVHVLGEPDKINSLLNLEFVSHIEFAANALNNRNFNEARELKSKLETQVEYNYGLAKNQVEMLRADFLHENNFTGEGMTIAVLDAGFPNVNSIAAFGKLRESGNLLGGYDFPNRSSNYNNPQLSNHGTLVLSDMAGFLENRFVGTAPNASYYLFRTEIGASETPVEESYWVEAAERADSLGVDIINSSLSYTLFDESKYDYSPVDMDGKTAFVSRGANIATEKGILVVVSAGNSAQRDEFPIIGAPADANVLTVGAVDANRNYAAFSSIGPTADNRIKPDVMAQGLEISAIDPSNTLVTASGTSFSSPILAGAIASFWQVDPNLTNREIMDLVIQSASLYSSPNSRMGYGIPNFEEAYTFLVPVNELSSEFAVYPNPVQNMLQIISPGTKDFKISIFDMLGQKLVEKSTSEKEIDLSGFSRGIYIVMFEQQNKIKKSTLIIKN